MKKIKLNLDKDAIRQLFLEHAEKIVFAVVVLCFVAIVYKAFARERFDNTPGKLNNRAQTAEDHWLKDTNVEDAVKSLIREAPSLAGIVSKVDPDPVREDLYKHPNVWDPSIFDPPALRGEPPLYPVEGLRGFAGVGAFSMALEKSGEDVEAARPDRPKAAPKATPRTAKSNVSGQRWVVLTGLVPYQKQLDDFAEYFRGVEFHDPERDVPRYIYYEVQRAEVNDPRDTANLQWQLFNSWIEMKVAHKWASGSTGIVEKKYVHERLTFPLPPRIDADRLGPVSRVTGQTQILWDENEVAHPPEIGFPVRTNTSASPKTEENEDPYVEDVPFTGTERRTAHLPTVAYGAQSQTPEHLLFRYFDFHVEPGKSYKYRVRLLLSNPNFGVEDRYLDESVLAMKKQREDLAQEEMIRGDLRGAERIRVLNGWKCVETKWTEMAETVFVPPDTRVLAVSVKPPSPSRPDADPTCTMMLVTWVEHDGRTAYEEFPSINRGQVLDFPGRTFPPNRPSPRPRRDPLDRPPPKPANSIPVDYLSEAVALDMRASRLAERGNETGPGVILLLDTDGKLVVRDELDDRPEYDKYVSRPVSADGSPSFREDVGDSDKFREFDMHAYDEFEE